MAASSRFLLLGVVQLAASVAEAAVPLQILDASARQVVVEIESSSAVDTVGQTFGPDFPASYSASGNVGTLVISAATHEAMWAGYFPAPVPGSFQPIVIEIDLTTRHAVSQGTSGGFASGSLTESFTQGVLRSDATQGVIVAGVPPFPCTSQAQVDMFCMSFPQFCGKTCSFVAGSAYDPANGKVNLVGIESRTGCDGGGACSGPFTFFTPRGDLRLTEAFSPTVPTLAPLPTALLLAALVLAGLVASRRLATGA